MSDQPAKSQDVEEKKSTTSSSNDSDVSHALHRDTDERGPSRDSDTNTDTARDEEGDSGADSSIESESPESAARNNLMNDVQSTLDNGSGLSTLGTLGRLQGNDTASPHLTAMEISGLSTGQQEGVEAQAQAAANSLNLEANRASEPGIFSRLWSGVKDTATAVKEAVIDPAYNYVSSSFDWDSWFSGGDVSLASASANGDSNSDSISNGELADNFDYDSWLFSDDIWNDFDFWNDFENWDDLDLWSDLYQDGENDIWGDWNFWDDSEYWNDWDFWNDADFWGDSGNFENSAGETDPAKGNSSAPTFTSSEDGAYTFQGGNGQNLTMRATGETDADGAMILAGEGDTRFKLKVDDSTGVSVLEHPDGNIYAFNKEGNIELAKIGDRIHKYMSNGEQFSAGDGGTELLGKDGHVDVKMEIGKFDRRFTDGQVVSVHLDKAPPKDGAGLANLGDGIHIFQQNGIDIIMAKSGDNAAYRGRGEDGKPRHTMILGDNVFVREGNEAPWNRLTENGARVVPTAEQLKALRDREIPRANGAPAGETGFVLGRQILAGDDDAGTSVAATLADERQAQRLKAEIASGELEIAKLIESPETLQEFGALGVTVNDGNGSKLYDYERSEITDFSGPKWQVTDMVTGAAKWAYDTLTAGVDFLNGSVLDPIRGFFDSNNGLSMDMDGNVSGGGFIPEGTILNSKSFMGCPEENAKVASAAQEASALSSIALSIAIGGNLSAAMGMLASASSRISSLDVGVSNVATKMFAQATVDAVRSRVENGMKAVQVATISTPMASDKFAMNEMVRVAALTNATPTELAMRFSRERSTNNTQDKSSVA